jgi:hypothetical protein
MAVLGVDSLEEAERLVALDRPEADGGDDGLG